MEDIIGCSDERRNCGHLEERCQRGRGRKEETYSFDAGARVSTVFRDWIRECIVLGDL